MPPGNTNFPDASNTWRTFSSGRSLPIAATLPSTRATSATYESVAVTTVPLRIIASKCIETSVRKQQRTMLHCRTLVLTGGGACIEKGTSHAIWHNDQARYLDRTHRRFNARSRERGICIRLDLRFARSVERTVPAAHADGWQHEADEVGNMRDQSCDARSHRDCQLVRDTQPDFWRTHGTRHWPRGQFPARAGEKAGELVPTGNGGERVS